MSRRSDSDRLAQRWRELVEIESGSHDPEGLQAMADAMMAHLSDLGFEVAVAGRAESGGPHLLASRGGTDGKPVMLLGHLDTVWDRGALEKNPFRQEGDRLYGPGIADMKGGLAVMLEAIRTAERAPRLQVILTADEELGSPTGRPVIEEAARDCRAALVFEAGRLGGGLVDRRRGIAVMTLTVHGKTAHAGNDPENGVNAVDELAHQLLELAALRDPEAGIYVMAGVVEGGTARQVVPDRASALIDVRGATRDGLDSTVARIRDLENRVHVEGARVVVEGGETRPPFEAVPGSDAIKALVRAAAADTGTTAEFVAAGGGSDGNFTAALGVPTIDSLGPVGHRLCSWDEAAEWPSAIDRTNLVSRLLERLAVDA